MSNGIVQKNVYYGISADNRIPYRSGSDIFLNNNPEDLIDVSQIDAIQVNNLLGQLQDNDRYVKAHISKLNQQDGSPQTYSAETLGRLPDGSKVMGGSGTEELVIEQKIETALSDTVERIGPQIDILCSRNFGNWFLVGTSDGLYVTNDGLGYEGPKSMVPDPLEEPEYQIEDVTVGDDSTVRVTEDEEGGDEPADGNEEDPQAMAIFDITIPYNDLVFAASQSGVYQIQRDDQDGFRLVRLNVQGLTGCRKICYDPKTRTIIVSIGSDVYFGTFDPTLSPDRQVRSIRFRQAGSGSADEAIGRITGMVSDESTVYMSTLSGLAFGRFGLGDEATRILGGIEIFCHQDSLVGTSQGLYDLDGNLVALPECPIYSIFGFDGGYLLGSDSQIIDYRLSGSL